MSNIDKDNPLLYSSKDIYDNTVEGNNVDKNSDDDYIDIFSFNNIILEYSFKSKRCSLYSQYEEDKCELLYESYVDENLLSAYFFTKNKVYILTDYDVNTRDLRSLDCMSRDKFMFFIQHFDIASDNKLVKNISQLASMPYMIKHATNLVNHGDINNNNSVRHIWDDYRKVYASYTSATQLIPSSNILDEILQNINTYIATRNYDASAFDKSFNELQDFKETCPDSIKRLSDFMENPESTDLQQLCDSLNKNMRNIDNLLYMYLDGIVKPEEEIEK